MSNLDQNILSKKLTKKKTDFYCSKITQIEMDIIVFYYLCERLHLKSTQNKLNTTYRLINFQKIVNELIVFVTNII